MESDNNSVIENTIVYRDLRHDVRLMCESIADGIKEREENGEYGRIEKVDVDVLREIKHVLYFLTKLDP